jgi:hypothetical protein
MIESNERVQQFKGEIASMKLRDPATGRDALLLKVGAVGMAAGIVITVVAYFMSHGTSSPLSQNDAQTLGMIGIAVAVVGGALFLRYSMAQFLRFWLARLIYEQQAQTDRVVGTAVPAQPPNKQTTETTESAEPPTTEAAEPAATQAADGAQPQPV